jgi:hypothetical protein
MTFVVVANLDDLEVGDTMLVDELREPICLIRLDDDDVRAIHNPCTRAPSRTMTHWSAPPTRHATT